MRSLLGNTRKNDITIYSSGRIDISAHVSNLLDLKRGDVIDLLDSGSEYYIYIRHHAPTVGRHEATCFPTKEGGKHFRTYSLRLCNALMKVFSCDNNKIGLVVGEPVSLLQAPVALPIINRKNDTGN